MFKTIKEVVSVAVEGFKQGYAEAKYTVTGDQAASVFADVVKKSGLDVRVVLVEDAPPMPGTVAFVDVEDQSKIFVFEQTVQSLAHMSSLCKRSNLNITTLLQCVAAHELGHTQDTDMSDIVARRIHGYKEVNRVGLSNLTADIINLFHDATIELESNAYTLGREYAYNKRAYDQFNKDNIQMCVMQKHHDLATYTK